MASAGRRALPGRLSPSQTGELQLFTTPHAGGHLALRRPTYPCAGGRGARLEVSVPPGIVSRFVS